MKTKNSLRNLLVSFIGQFLGILITFISRKIFINSLGGNYLGIDGLFANIITLLSLVELGIGPAMSYALYYPISKNDTEKIKSLMNLYKNAYRIIGIIVLFIGFCLLPIYRYLINDVPNINNLDLIFILFVLNTAFSYFYSYKRSLIICNEKKYITTIVKYSCYFVLNLIQIIFLIITKNYILYLIFQILFTIIENIVISIIANKLYPFLKEKNIKKLEKKEKYQLKQNVIAMLFHKIGGMIVNSTDNLIISKYIGLIAVGINSNYLLIINALTTITNQFFEAIVASIGKIGAENDKQKLENVFNKVFLIDYWLFALISCFLAVFMNDFIQIWIGDNFIFSKSITYIIIINFYLRGIRKGCLTFRDALGLFWHDRYKPLIESLINIIVSLLLVKKYGVEGVFIGTIVSCITTSLWIEPLILYKYGFNKSVIEYLKKLLLFSFIGFISTSICVLISNYIIIQGIFGIILKFLVSFIIFNTINIIIFFNNNDFKFLIQLLKNILKIR